MLAALCAALAAGSSCHRERAQPSPAAMPRLARYNCNIAESRDIVDVYAEVVNDGNVTTPPAELLLRIDREGKPDVTGLAEIRPLKPHEAYEVGLRANCKGRIGLHQVHLSVEPARGVEPGPPARPAERR
jgi:hypothetical protein